MIILRGLHGPHRPRLCSYRVTALRRRCQAAAAVAGPGSAIDSSRVASRVGSEGSGPGRRCQAGQHVTARTRRSNTDNVATSAYARSAVTRRAPALSWSTASSRQSNAPPPHRARSITHRAGPPRPARHTRRGPTAASPDPNTAARPAGRPPPLSRPDRTRGPVAQGSGTWRAVVAHWSLQQVYWYFMWLPGHPLPVKLHLETASNWSHATFCRNRVRACVCVCARACVRARVTQKASNWSHAT